MPAITCSVVGCDNTKNQYRDLFFFKFPFKKSLRETWVIRTGQPSTWRPNRTSKICDVHFNSSMFSRYSQIKKLNPGAVPTLHLPEPGEEEDEGQDEPGPSSANNHQPLQEDGEDANSTEEEEEGEGDVPGQGEAVVDIPDAAVEDAAHPDGEDEAVEPQVTEEEEVLPEEEVLEEEEILPEEVDV